MPLLSLAAPPPRHLHPKVQVLQVSGGVLLGSIRDGLRKRGGLWGLGLGSAVGPRWQPTGCSMRRSLRTCLLSRRLPEQSPSLFAHTGTYRYVQVASRCQPVWSGLVVAYPTLTVTHNMQPTGVLFCSLRRRRVHHYCNETRLQ